VSELFINKNEFLSPRSLGNAQEIRSDRTDAVDAHPQPKNAEGNLVKECSIANFGA
jgi:hypothetical protein